MNTFHRLTRCLLGAAWLAAAGMASAGKAHEHGVARMDLAVEGSQVSIGIELPLDSLLGFEHAPRTPAEREAATAALARLRNGAALLRFDAAAQCSQTGVTIEAPVLEQPAGAARSEHADLEVHYVFHCAQPGQLATLELGLFDALRRVERVHVQAVLPQGQRKAVLRRSARVLRLRS